MVQSLESSLCAAFPRRYLADDTDYDKRWKYFEGQRDRFMHNLREYLVDGRVVVVEGFSQDLLPTLLEEWANKIDFVYIDGDHRADPVYLDAILSFPLMRPGTGTMIFDGARNCCLYFCIFSGR